jgi:hypothetical protein
MSNHTMSTPRWMMDSEFEVDGYEYYNTDDEEEEEEDDNDNDFDEYRNDVLYDYCNNIIYNEEYNSEDEEIDDTNDE